jgi:hypothetical protein
VPACANTYLMQELARDTWGFKGYVVSDCGAISNIGTAPLPAPLSPPLSTTATTTSWPPLAHASA